MNTQSSQSRPNVIKTAGMPSGREIAFLVVGSLASIFAAYALFSANPELDLQVSYYFQFGEQRFILGSVPAVSIARRVMMYGFAVFYICVVVFGLMAWRNAKPVLHLQWHKWMFAGLCGLAGPTLLVNVILKANWGRARPLQTLELGGNLEFTSFWVWTDQCPANCSFVSGEVATAVMIPVSLALVSAKMRPTLYLAAILACAFDGYLRIAQGAHYLSDAFMTLPLMLITACGLYYFFYLWPNTPVAKFSPPAKSD